MCASWRQDIICSGQYSFTAGVETYPIFSVLQLLLSTIADCSSVIDYIPHNVIWVRYHLATCSTSHCYFWPFHCTSTQLLQSFLLSPYHTQLCRTVLFPLSPIISQGLMYFYDSILQIRSHLVASCPVLLRFNLADMIPSCCLLPCTISI